MPLQVAHAAAGLTKSYKFLNLFYHFYKVLFLGVFIPKVLIRAIFDRIESFRNGNICFDKPRLSKSYKDLMFISENVWAP